MSVDIRYDHNSLASTEINILLRLNTFLGIKNTFAIWIMFKLDPLSVTLPLVSQLPPSTSCPANWILLAPCQE
jgi:hypothetical protein